MAYEFRPNDMPPSEEAACNLRAALHRADHAIELFKRAVLQATPQRHEVLGGGYGTPMLGPNIPRTSRVLAEAKMPADKLTAVAIAVRIYSELEAAAALYGSTDKRGYTQLLRLKKPGDGDFTPYYGYRGEYLALGTVFKPSSDLNTPYVVSFDQYDDEKRTRFIYAVPQE